MNEEIERKIHKISEKEFVLLNEYKRRLEKDAKEQIAQQAVRTLAHNKNRIAHMEREIVFKQDQIDSKNVVEKHEQFKDNLKPLFYLQGDIEELSFQISNIKEDDGKIREELDANTK